KQEAGRVHEKEVGVSEASGLNGAIEVRDVSPSDAPEDVGGGKTGVIQKVRDVVRRHIEISKAVEQIGATHTARTGSARDVVLHHSGRRRGREIDLRVQARGGNGRWRWRDLSLTRR